ncbi:MAG: hypothetical protein EBU84_01725 [Actinobacteria bacterium]|nr:hypothetical protein [Actinomycetota bacterium]
MIMPMGGLIYQSRQEGRGLSEVEHYTKWFVRHGLSLVLRNDGGLWLCEAVGRHGDLPFSARGERLASMDSAVHSCFLAARDVLRSEPYIMG